MDTKASIERIAEKLEQLAEVTPDTGKMSIERIAVAIEKLADVEPEEGQSTLDRISDAVEIYTPSGGGGGDYSVDPTYVATGTDLNWEGGNGDYAAELKGTEYGAPSESIWYAIQMDDTVVLRKFTAITIMQQASVNIASGDNAGVLTIQCAGGEWEAALQMIGSNAPTIKTIKVFEFEIVPNA